MAKLLDPKRGGKYPFNYTSASATRLALTFARVRREMKKRDEPLPNVTVLKRASS
jgi:hypothetical protein